MTRSISSFVALAAVTLFAFTPARAEEAASSSTSPSIDGLLAVHAGLTWVIEAPVPATGVGGGVTYQKTIAPGGFLRTRGILKDDIGIEGGVEYYGTSWTVFGITQSANVLQFMLGGAWNLWLSDRFAFYPKVSLVYRKASGDLINPGNSFDVDGAAGFIYKAGAIHLKGEAGLMAVRLGVGMAF